MVGIHKRRIGMDRKQILNEKNRIVIKVGTTTITYEETGNINLDKLEKFVRVLINLRNKGKEVIVVSSGAVGVGRKALGMEHKPETEAAKQACAAVGQGRLMMIYEKLFNEYSQLTAQVLLTKEFITNKECRKNARQTFDELLRMNVVPIVNENDAISVDELAYGNFGDNDTLAANVSELVDADLLILMSDIEGMYTADPKKNQNARFIHTVVEIDESLEAMAGGSASDFGTGGMIIANGDNIYAINDIMAGKKIGTLFLSKEHGKQMENELAPERAKFRRQVKNLKKSEGKSEEHKTTEFIQNEEHLAGGNDGKLYGNTW